MDVIDHLYLWTSYVLAGLTLALRVWAFVDCLTRKAAAFPAVDKLTKPAWLAILLISGVIGTLVGTVSSLLSLVSIVVAAVYLADVRPAVRGIVSGR